MSKLSDYKKGTYIYALRQSGDSKIMYVGLTDEPARRLLEHAYFGRGTDIEMVLLEKYRDFRTACNAERKWIAYFAKLNPEMWNGPNIKKDYGSLDIQVSLVDVQCITVPMAEAVMAYRGITIDQYMFDCTTGLPIHDNYYTFVPRPFVKKIIKSWDICWQDTPFAVETHCRLAFDVMGIDGDWTSCLRQTMESSGFSASDVFNASILLAHYGNFGLPVRRRDCHDVSRIRKMMAMTYDELYDGWPILSTRILTYMPDRVKVLTEAFSDIEVVEGTVNVPRPKVLPTAPQPAQKVNE